MQGGRSNQVSRTVHLETGMTMTFGCRRNSAAAGRGGEEHSRTGGHPAAEPLQGTPGAIDGRPFLKRVPPDQELG